MVLEKVMPRRLTTQELVAKARKDKEKAKAQAALAQSNPRLLKAQQKQAAKEYTQKQKEKAAKYKANHPEQQSGFNKFLHGTPENIRQLERFTPEQKALADANIKAAMSQLQNINNLKPTQPTNVNVQPLTPLANTEFGPIEQQYRSNFPHTIASIADRFTASGGQGTGAFKRALGSAAANLETDLAAMKAQHGFQQNQQTLQQNQQTLAQNQQGFQQAGLNQNQQGLDQNQRQLLQQYLQQLQSVGLTPQFDTNIQESTPGLLQNAAEGLGNLLTSAPQLLTAFLTGGRSNGKDNEQQQQPQNKQIQNAPAAPVAPAAQVSPVYNNAAQGMPNAQTNQSQLSSFKPNVQPSLLSVLNTLSTPQVANQEFSNGAPKFSRTGIQASPGFVSSNDASSFGGNDYGSSFKTAPTLNILRALSNPSIYNPQLKALLAAQGGLFGNDNQVNR